MFFYVDPHYICNIHIQELFPAIRSYSSRPCAPRLTLYSPAPAVG